MIRTWWKMIIIEVIEEENIEILYGDRVEIFIVSDWAQNDPWRLGENILKFSVIKVLPVLKVFRFLVPIDS